MDKLYLYLLNRYPTKKEFLQNKQKNMNVLNREICQSSEYINFMNNNYSIIENKLRTIFFLANKVKIENKVLYDLYNFYRANKYSVSLLNKYLNNCKDRYFLKMNATLNKFGLNCSILNTKECLYNYINSCFDEKSIETSIIYSNEIYNLLEVKILNLL